MIGNYNTLWLQYLKDIDVKSYDYPWLDIDWDDIKKWIIKVWMFEDQPRGFIAYRFVDPEKILIAKLAVHPSFRRHHGGEELLQEMEVVSKFSGVKYVTALLHEDNDFKDWAVKQGFKAIHIEYCAFPHGDGYFFQKVLE